MNLVTCLSELVPCPPGDQSVLSLSDALDPVSLGVSAESIAQVFAWGFGSVLGFWLLAYSIAAVLMVVRKI